MIKYANSTTVERCSTMEDYLFTLWLKTLYMILMRRDHTSLYVFRKAFCLIRDADGLTYHLMADEWIEVKDGEQSRQRLYAKILWRKTKDPVIFWITYRPHQELDQTGKDLKALHGYNVSLDARGRESLGDIFVLRTKGYDTPIRLVLRLN